MKSVFRWTAVAMLVCSIPVAAEGPRQIERRSPETNRPVIIDGVRYESWQEVADAYPGEVRYTVEERDATYGFTTADGAREFGREQALKSSGRLKRITAENHIFSGCSGFNKNIGCNGTDWLVLCPLNEIARLSNSWNDVISCVEAGDDVGYYTVLYKCYDFSPYPTYNCKDQIKWVAPGVTITDLTAPQPYNMNNVTSSIRFCSNIDPYSCTH